jgi:predicted XRE-type DNA-binding protein
MKRDDLELVRCSGSGNGYRDFARPNADLEQARAITAATIIRIIDARKLSTRGAEKLTGVSHSEFSRIRNIQLGRFTLDRMIAILGKLDDEIEVSVCFRTRKRRLPAASRVPPVKPVRGIRRPNEVRRVRKAQRP